VLDFKAYIAEFKRYMDSAYRNNVKSPHRERPNVGWLQSEQIMQLLATAQPGGGNFPGKLKAMVLTVTPQRNEFRDAKGGKESDALVLSPYARFDGLPDRTLFPPIDASPMSDKDGAVRQASHSGARGPSRQTTRLPVQRQPAGAGTPRPGGWSVGDKVIYADEEGTIKGFEGDRVLIDFGDGPEPIPLAELGKA